jgi:hypothetical protein
MERFFVHAPPLRGWYSNPALLALKNAPVKGAFFSSLPIQKIPKLLGTLGTLFTHGNSNILILIRY